MQYGIPMKRFAVKTVITALAIWTANAPSTEAQTSSAPQVPVLSFDVASVRQNLAGEDGPASNAPHVNFPIGSDDAFYNTGGVFSATNLPLLSFLIFAYRINTNNRQALVDSLPEWVKNEHYNIEARTELKDVTKDQMRSMMQALLNDRFHLVVHRETRIVNVFAAALSHPDALGPQLRAHPSDIICPAETPNPTSSNKIANEPVIDHLGFPNVCGRFVNSMKSDEPHHRRFGGGKLTMSTIVGSFTGVGGLGRPVIDKTGLNGTYDFFLDFLPAPPPTSDPIPDAEGPEFVEAVKTELGLKLVPDKAPVEFVLVDHIERPTPN